MSDPGTMIDLLMETADFVSLSAMNGRREDREDLHRWLWERIALIEGSVAS